VSLCSNQNIKAKGQNEHHKAEAIFKAFARALRQAVRVEGNEFPNTKRKL
jgi:imidazoleglycerol-phosphate dehydratase/histidinol-phosphatase